LQVFSDGEDVVTWLKSSRVYFPVPAAMFVALKLPRMGGLEVLRYVSAASLRDFSTIVLVKTQESVLMPAAYQLGAFTFLKLPFQKREICDLLLRLNGVDMEGCCAPAKGLSWSTNKPLEQPAPGGVARGVAPLLALIQPAAADNWQPRRNAK
jgi:CheY-like chemotaxis protein